MEKLRTPFGDIDILIDGIIIDYVAQRGNDNDALWPDVHNRFRIEVNYNPDGKEHSISCVFSDNCSHKREPESGERLECQSFYNEQKIKMSIGLECESGYCGTDRISDEYDYDVEYLENGMAYIIMPDTITNKYTFGIAWIDDVGYNDPVDDEHKRDVQTWFASDPTYEL